MLPFGGQAEEKVALAMEGNDVVGADGQFATETVPLGWSSDGTKLLFLRADPSPPDRQPPFEKLLYILHAGGTETQVTPGPVRDAAISPDGSRVAFATADVPGRASQLPEGLYVVDADGGEPVRIAQEGTSPTFSPDGTQIAYLASPPGVTVDGVTGSAPVWVVDADGTDAHQILADDQSDAFGGFERIAWSPAGDRIAMYRRDDIGQEATGAIDTFAPDGSGFTEVTAGGDMHWSPDGSQIAYDCLPDQDCTFAIVLADGLTVRGFGVGASGPWHPGRSPEFSRFDSPIHGLSIDYPSGWQVRPATEAWTGDPLGFDAPAADVIFDPALGDKVYLLIASLPYSGDRPGSIKGDWPSDTEWFCRGGPSGSWQVDGARAWVQDCTGPDRPGANNIALVYTDARAYLIQLLVSSDEPKLVETYGWDWLKQALATVDLRPEEAVDALSPTKSPSLTPSPSPVTPTPSPRLDAEQIIAEGGLNAFAMTRSGTLLTVWGTCAFLETGCRWAWRLGSGSQPQATGVVVTEGASGDSSDVFVPVAAGDGFILAPPNGGDTGIRIAPYGTVSSISMACRDASWTTPFAETWTAEKLPWVTTTAVHSFEALPPLDAYEGLIREYAEWEGK